MRPTGSKNVKWNKEELQRLYWDERMSCYAIAKQYGTVYQAVLKALQRFGIPRRSHSEATSKELHYRWQGGRYINTNGYTMIRVGEDYVPEHIVIWEKHNGRKLRKGEIVHHLNGIKVDNAPLNLLAMMKSTHDKLVPALRTRIRQLEQELNRCRQMVMELKV